ncbi:DUF799 domain-containing protein [Pseudoalteromonas luteoviolacea]|uniref:DUF799 domain-containing protein n=1 Tax=Pseudoalteromonas luteoviolacea TaxID=43657 RepID=UPI001F363A30|nr:DUF799 domain-containing protein [Pseudoalteromonas luteoviolacea]MCF6438725.1 DUF799 domain-containing protein [Pseudoalteromonas luteoviolacea]
MKKGLFILAMLTLLSGCVSSPEPHDYSEFRNSDPRSVVILPPLNNSPEVIAPYSLLSQMSQPIAESGFYVFPVAVVEQTFRNNGITVATDAHALPTTKLQEIFGADTALYVSIEEYGTSYVVLSSDTVVSVSAKLVDLKTGNLLWEHAARASSAETRSSGGHGLVGMLVEAAVNQIVESAFDAGFDIARIASHRLLSSEVHNGLLHGPRSLKYGEPATSEKAN